MRLPARARDRRLISRMRYVPVVDGPDHRASDERDGFADSVSRLKFTCPMLPAARTLLAGLTSRRGCAG